MIHRVLFVICCLAMQCSMALASDMVRKAAPPPPASDLLYRKDTIFVFGGVYSRDDMKDSVIPGAASLERNYLLAVAYDRPLAHLKMGLVVGGEVGVGARVGDGVSGEFWGGLSFRPQQGISLGHGVTMSPGFVFGLSVFTNPMGIEREHQLRHGGNAYVLFYLGPELAFTFKQWPNTQFVYRLHHRSGGYGTLGGMHEGHNAQTFGVRWRL